MKPSPRRVAVLGGNRIPFARSNTAYSDASNQEMLTAAIDGLATRFGLEGERVGEVVAGAVLKHARDFDPATVQMRPSRQGKYLSVTCVVRATSRDQLDALYRELCDHPSVVMVL